MIDLRHGNCLEILKNIDSNSVDLILTDPPYHLTSITKRFGKKGSAPASTKNNDGSFSRLSKGFMGKEWDGLDENGVGIAFNVEVWKEAYRVLKPGGYCMAFSGSRTYHRMAVAIEDAGFEIKDMIEWVYGSGFPKALDISKAIDKKLGAEREVVGQKLQHNIKNKELFQGKGEFITLDITAPSSDIAKQYEGYKTQLKPAHEPICLAMKPLSEKTFAEYVMRWGTGGLNIDGTRVELNGEKQPTGSGDRTKGMFGSAKEKQPYKNITPVDGRYPANLIIHKDVAPVLDEQSGILKSGGGNKNSKNPNKCLYRVGGVSTKTNWESNAGGASRFFYNAKIEEEDYIPFKYTAKASKKERNTDINGDVVLNNNHATVKPISIMEYLAKLGLPPYNAVVLDMFAGSGSTGMAIEKINKETVSDNKTILIEIEKQ